MNYPDGAANDKRAPYNQKDVEMTEFEPCAIADCKECREPMVMCNEDSICEHCFEPKEVEAEDLYNGDEGL